MIHSDLDPTTQTAIVQDLLPLGVSLNIPPFLGTSSQMPADDVIKTQEIASLRIDVEWTINKIKNFHVWDGVIPLHQSGIVNQMCTVCTLLFNAQSNISMWMLWFKKWEMSINKTILYITLIAVLVYCPKKSWQVMHPSISMQFILFYSPSLRAKSIFLL